MALMSSKHVSEKTMKLLPWWLPWGLLFITCTRNFCYLIRGPVWRRQQAVSKLKSSTNVLNSGLYPLQHINKDLPRWCSSTTTCGIFLPEAPDILLKTQTILSLSFKNSWPNIFFKASMFGVNWFARTVASTHTTIQIILLGGKRIKKRQFVNLIPDALN